MNMKQRKGLGDSYGKASNTKTATKAAPVYENASNWQRETN